MCLRASPPAPTRPQIMDVSGRISVPFGPVFRSRPDVHVDEPTVPHPPIENEFPGGLVRKMISFAQSRRLTVGPYSKWIPRCYAIRNRIALAATSVPSKPASSAPESTISVQCTGVELPAKTLATPSIQTKILCQYYAILYACYPWIFDLLDTFSSWLNFGFPDWWLNCLFILCLVIWLSSWSNRSYIRHRNSKYLRATSSSHRPIMILLRLAHNVRLFLVIVFGYRVTAVHRASIADQCSMLSCWLDPLVWMHDHYATNCLICLKFVAIDD
jgi:hypothetical protein